MSYRLMSAFVDAYRESDGERFTILVSNSLASSHALVKLVHAGGDQVANTGAVNYDLSIESLLEWATPLMDAYDVAADDEEEDDVA